MELYYKRGMEKFFNIAGPCNPVDHYMLSATERLPEIVSLVRKKQYFVVHAQRQCGKTTAMLALRNESTSKEDRRMGYTAHVAAPAERMRKVAALVAGAAVFVVMSAAYAGETVIWDDRPAGGDWAAEWYPVGNGSLGAMVKGEVARETIQFNIDSLWTGAENISGVTSDADASANYRTMGSHQNMGELLIDLYGFDGRADGYRRELNISSGVFAQRFSMDGAVFERRVFASAPDRAIGVSMRSERPLSGKAFLHGAHGENVSTMFCSVLPNRLGYRARIDVVADGKPCPDGVFADATNVVLWLRAATSLDLDAGDFGLNGRIPAISGPPPEDFEDALGRAVADHARYFNRVFLSLGGDSSAVSSLPTRVRLERCRNGVVDVGLQELMFQYGRYLLIACSRPGTLPAHLQGLWNDSNDPPWHCDYHTNINMQMNYWAVETANLSEMWEPMSHLMSASMRVASKETRKAFPGHEGFAFRTSMNFIGGQGWRWNFAGAPWMAVMMYDHYLFTKDRAYLAQSAYPFMKGAMQFMFSHLGTRDDGKLVVKNGWSPEHGPREDGVAHDQQIVRELLKAIVGAQAVLGGDSAFAAKCADTLAALAPDKVGRWGQLQEWQEDRDVQGDTHRHTSHLFAVYPGTTITRQDTPDLARAASVALDGRALTGDARRSWTWPWRAAIRARLGEAERAGQMVSSLLRYNTLPNLMCVHPPMQMDGNFGITAAMSEMLVQSHETTEDGKVLIRLLPALPAMWAAHGEVRGLRTRGGYTVDVSWKDGKVSASSVTGGDPGRYVLRSR